MVGFGTIQYPKSFVALLNTLDRKGKAERNGVKFWTEERKISYNHYTHVVCYDLGDGRNEAGFLEDPDSLYDDYTNLLWRVLGTKRVLV